MNGSVLYRDRLRCRRQQSRATRRQSGLTIVELLVAIGATLILMLAVTQIFAVLGSNIAIGRSTIELSGEMRGVAHRLQSDLDGLTLPVLPWNRPEAGDGYFEYIEALGLKSPGGGAPQQVRGHDYSPYYMGQGGTLGDRDDVLCFTARSNGEPFRGRFNGQIIESSVAEIVWWTVARKWLTASGTATNPFAYDSPYENNSNDQTNPYEDVVLFRRVLLIRPDLNAQLATMSFGSSFQFFNDNDISARVVGNSMVANSLADLVERENRFGHQLIDANDLIDPTTSNSPFPYQLQRKYLARLQGQMYDEDIVLSHVLAFDVKVYDPKAPLYKALPINDPNNLNSANIPVPNVVLNPSDAGYLATRFSAQSQNIAPVGFGAYVDLYYMYGFPDPQYNLPQTSNAADWFRAPTDFSGPPHLKSRLHYLNAGNTPQGRPTYDTWPFHYEHDGRGQNSSFTGLPIDSGTNGFDDNQQGQPGYGLVDDPTEYETSPPYPIPLRGIQVTIRALEPSTQQVRQVTVTADYLPE